MTPGAPMWGMPPGSAVRIDMNANRKRRIEKWLAENQRQVSLYSTEDLLLKFELFLTECEVERMRA